MGDAGAEVDVAGVDVDESVEIEGRSVRELGSMFEVAWRALIKSLGSSDMGLVLKIFVEGVDAVTRRTASTPSPTVSI